MDRIHFDSLARTLARRLDRRATLAAALGLAAGASLAGAGVASAATCRDGGHTCRRDDQCCSGACQVGRDVPIQRRNRCACAEGQTTCGARCVDTASDPRNCGACGNRCSHGVACIDGACIDLRPCIASGAELCVVTAEGAVVGDAGECLVELARDSCSATSDCVSVFADILEQYPELATLFEDGDYQTLCLSALAVDGEAIFRVDGMCIAYVPTDLCLAR
jgi:hypothetical protein